MRPFDPRVVQVPTANRTIPEYTNMSASLASSAALCNTAVGTAGKIARSRRAPVTRVFASSRDAAPVEAVELPRRSALALDRGARRTLVRGCLFRDVGGAAYQLGRWDSADEAEASRQERDNTLRDSILADVGAEYRGAAAVQVGYAPPTQPQPAHGPCPLTPGH